MTDHKDQTLTPEHPEAREPATNGSQRFKQSFGERAGSGLVSKDGRDVGGYDAYRRWVSRVQLPDKRRVAMDPSLYTWKGYRNWADKVRRDWNPEKK